MNRATVCDPRQSISPSTWFLTRIMQVIPELLGREILLYGRLWLVCQRHSSPESAQPVHNCPCWREWTKKSDLFPNTTESLNISVEANLCNVLIPRNTMWSSLQVGNNWAPAHGPPRPATNAKVTCGMRTKQLKLLPRRSSGSFNHLCGAPLFFSSIMALLQPAQTHTIVIITLLSSFSPSFSPVSVWKGWRHNFNLFWLFIVLLKLIQS